MYVMDRGYLDFKRLHDMNLCLAFFVIRSKTNTQLRRLYSAPVDKTLGILCAKPYGCRAQNSKGVSGKTETNKVLR